MTAKQRAQLQKVENILSAMVAELQPRVIMPSADKQKALHLAEETMLIPVGSGRAITVSPQSNGNWSITEFDTSSGGLEPIWEESAELSDELVIAVVLGAAVGSLQEQVEVGGEDRAALESLHFVLKARHTQLIEQGIESFEFEAADAQLVDS